MIPQTAPRFDLYAAIHKALRAFMNDTLQRVGAMDLADAGETERTLAQLDELLALLRSHLRHENDHVHTAIEARRPNGSSRIADEHLGHLQSIAALQEEAAALRKAPEAARAGSAHRLYHHLASFVAENLEHMHYEETAHNALLWQLYSDEELLAVHDRLLASVKPADMLLCLRWMAPTLRPQELLMVLADIRKSAPPPAFAQVMGLVHDAVDTPRWQKLQAALA